VKKPTITPVDMINDWRILRTVSIICKSFISPPLIFLLEHGKSDNNCQVFIILGYFFVCFKDENLTQMVFTTPLLSKDSAKRLKAFKGVYCRG
jgi:hypothetical protein